jgi:hypothetical protein
VRNIIKKILRESDDFDWIRDTGPTFVPFEDVSVGETYMAEPTDVLRDAIEACNNYVGILKSKKVEVLNVDKLSYDQIFCGHTREDYVLALRLRFYDEHDVPTTLFWVSEDMLLLYK